MSLVRRSNLTPFEPKISQLPSAVNVELNSFESISISVEIADAAGELICSYRKEGVALGDVDAVIAASALENNLALVTTNARHFPMPGLAILQADEEGHLNQCAK